MFRYMKFREIIKKILFVAAAVIVVKTTMSVIQWGDTDPERLDRKNKLTKIRAERDEHRKNRNKLRQEREQQLCTNESCESLTTVGTKTLNKCMISGRYSSTGKLECYHSNLDSLDTTGPTMLRHSTVHGHIASTGTFEAYDSSFGSIEGTGSLVLKNTKTTGMLNNTGDSTFTNCVLHKVDITGQLNASSTEFNSLDATGKATIYDSNFQKFEICGSTTLSNSKAYIGDIVGSVTAEKCSLNDLKLTSKNVKLTDCKIKTLHIRPDKSNRKTTIHINKTVGADEDTYIAKIVCENPNTEIIYGPNARQADEISGITNITYA